MNYLYPIVAVALLLLPAVAYADDPAPDDPGIAPAPQAGPQAIAVPPDPPHRTGKTLYARSSV